MRKPPCRTETVLERLVPIFAELRGRGELFIPSERALAERVGTSRMTMRKALDILEQRGEITSGPRGRAFSGKGREETRGRIAFVSGGADWIIIPAWNRLWTHLQALGAAHGWAFKLVLCSATRPLDVAELEEVDYVVSTEVGTEATIGLAEFADGRGNVIGTREEHREAFKHVVCLDNVAAGRRAASILLDAGYGRPAFLRPENGDTSFSKRGQGFTAELAARLPEYQAPEVVIAARSTMEYVRKYLDRLDDLLTADIDSLFVATDEMINLAYDPFARAHRIPEEFGLVTLAGSHVSLAHHPPVTAVGHGSVEVARGILDLIEHIEDGGQPDEPSLTLVEPGVHLGATTRPVREGSG